MSLPVIAIPEDTITLWSSPNKPTRIRPYLVGEEKLLLIAQQTEDPEEVKKAVKQIIRRCTFNGVNPDTLPSFDIEWLFLQLRSRSVSNIIESNFRCQNPVANEGTAVGGQPVEGLTHPCGAAVKIRININDIKMTVPEGHTNKVMLTDTLGVTLKYPTSDVPDSTDITVLLQTYLETVFTTDGTVTEVSEQSPADVAAWIDTLSLDMVKKIQNFFLTMPQLSYTFTFKCEKCGYTEDIVLRGLMDFFD
jgi:hypothetical protein